MGKQRNSNLCNTFPPCFTFTPLYLPFFLHHLSNTLAIDFPSPYKPVDNILLNCGSSGNSTTLDGRTWIGDVNSKCFPQELSQNQDSLVPNSVKQSSFASQVPYTAARLSFSAFTYIFPATTGQKFVRLYFYLASYVNFHCFKVDVAKRAGQVIRVESENSDPFYHVYSKAFFSVKAGTFTLLRVFSASLTADADGDPDDTIFREFCVNMEEDERLNLTFTPSDSNSFAFVNGIEILSMTSYLYYSTPDDSGRFPLIGEQYTYSIGNRTALEMVYRINVGGSYISSTEDTGMFRRWEPDVEYLIPRKSALPVNMTIGLIFAKIPPYTAPQTVYRTARTMGMDKAFNKNHNLTWEFPVDSEFNYAVRLHFCEFQPELVDWHDRVFLIFIANQTAEKAADVMVWSGRRKGVPVYKDYAVSMVGKEGDREKKTNLSIILQANPDDWKTTFNDAILNGIEIFKISNPSGNLAGPNPGPLPLTPPTAVPPKNLVEAKNY
ncbi:hypothetical protein SO802_001851 [Lithocarpus litseifolius]|uniref:Malectin-like domain-containing protein n=1 Tax=Lithocarpus litseifolius TaxID=425828 RepID=A0AAW2DVI9_9ROSI